MLFWIAQIFGLASFVFYVASFQCKKKIRLANFTFAAQAFSIIQYALLGGLAGAIVKIFSIARTLLVIGEEKHKIKTPIPIFIIAGAMVIVAIFSYQSPLSLIVTLTSAAYALAWWFCSAQRIRYCAIAASIVWLIYDISVVSVFGSCTDVVAIASAAIGIFRYRRKKSKTATPTPALDEQTINDDASPKIH